jgi:cell division protease FtsH
MATPLAQLAQQPDPGVLASKTELTKALDTFHQSLATVQLVPVQNASMSVTERIQDFAADWGGVLGLVFMAAIVYVLWRTLKLMPRTKPVQIRPQAGQDIGWSEIAGVDEAKEELREVVDFLREPRRFRQLGARVPKGILLHGPPGTGKTLLAKAVAHESGAQFFSQSASSFVEMFAGLGAARIRRLFDEARKNAPAIIFIDELDAVGARRGSDNNSEREQTLNQLLVEMDGFSNSGQVVVMAASNLLEKLDPALLRPGRFDRQVFVSPPDVGGREHILEVHTRDKPLREDVELGVVAQQTSGLTGADLANICNEAAIFCARRGGVAIGARDFDDALERVIAGVQSSTTLNDHERRVVAYHEAGHALCRELLVTTDRVHKISIVPRGRALGYVMNLPDEDSYLKTRDELVDQMTVLLGGRVAEQVVFGAVTTGAADDLRRVADITHAMVHDYAMGTAPETSSRAIIDPEAVSDLTRRIGDEEQQYLAFEAHRSAVELITRHRGLLESFARALLDREVLERADIDRLMDGVPRIDRRVGVPGLRVAAASRLDLGRPGGV